MWEKDGRLSGGVEGWELEMKPLDMPNWQGLEALAASYFKHTKNLGKEQELMSGQNKWHKAHACFQSL